MPGASAHETIGATQELAADLSGLTMAVDTRALRTRLTIAPLLLLTILGVYLLDTHVTNGLAGATVIGLLSLAGLYEYVRMMRGAGFPCGRRILLTAALVLHASVFFFDSWQSIDSEIYLPVMTTIGLVFAMSVRALTRTRMQQGLEELGSTLLGFVLIAWPLYMSQALALRSLPALFYVVLVAKSGDIGGYFAGITFGKNKLIPHVSPGKSVEGAIGSVVLSCLLAVLLRGPLLSGTLEVPIWLAISFGLLINLTAQLGDLVESLLKRRCNVKDSSAILPQHGGVLDLVDSLLFSVPAFFFVLIRLT